MCRIFGLVANGKSITTLITKRGKYRSNLSCFFSFGGRGRDGIHIHRIRVYPRRKKTGDDSFNYSNSPKLLSQKNFFHRILDGIARQGQQFHSLFFFSRNISDMKKRLLVTEMANSTIYWCKEWEDSAIFLRSLNLFWTKIREKIFQNHPYRPETIIKSSQNHPKSTPWPFTNNHSTAP